MRVLVLSGGGSKGAYQAGAIATLSSKISWDGYCGVSVGALNAAFLAKWRTDHYGAQALVNMWRGIDNGDVKRWWWWPFNKRSIYSSAPLRMLVDENLDHSAIKISGKRLRVGAVSLTSGAYRLWTECDEDITEGVLASSAFPAGLEPVEARGELWADGGLRNVTPLKAAIDMGATEIDVIMCQPRGMAKAEIGGIIDVGIRSLDIMMNEIIETDLQVATLYNLLATCGETTKRYIPINVLRPTDPLEMSPLDFDRKGIASAITVGMRDAQRLIS